MAFADLSAQAKEGFNKYAKKLSDEERARKGDFLADGITPRPDLFPDGKALMDFHAEIKGCEYYESWNKLKEAQRLAKLAANSTVAATVDALPDIPGVG